MRLHTEVFVTLDEEASFRGSAGVLDGEEMNSSAFTSRLRRDDNTKLKRGSHFHESRRKCRSETVDFNKLQFTQTQT